MADGIIAMRKGRIAQVGSPDDLYLRPESLFVASFIGAPPINLMEGELRGDRLQVHDSVLSYQGQDSGTVVLGLRPESISGARDGDAHTGRHHEIEATVEVIEPTGPDTLAMIMLGGVECTARLRADAPARPGQPGRFMVDMGQARPFATATTPRL